MRKFQLSLPPLPEQKKVAHVLSTVQRAIEAQERIIQTTTELKKTLMHKLFTEGTSAGEPQKQTEIGPVPESWEVATIEEHCIASACRAEVQFGLSTHLKGTFLPSVRPRYLRIDGRISITTVTSPRKPRIELLSNVDEIRHLWTRRWKEIVVNRVAQSGSHCGQNRKCVRGAIGDAMVLPGAFYDAVLGE